MLSMTDDLGPPPAYSPHDPQTPTSDASYQPDTPISPLRPSIRGGYLSIVDDPREIPYSSAVAYFEGRSFRSDSALATILIEHKVTPHTTRDDLPLQSLLPDHSYGMETRDLHPQDWATFVNYIIAELKGSTSVRDQNLEKSISREDFQKRQKRIEAVVAEWNEGFFGPRRIRFVPEFSYSTPERPSSPTPSYKTFRTNQPTQEPTSFGPPLPQQATFLHHRQPQVLQHNVTEQSKDAPGVYLNPLGLFTTGRGRGFHWRGRGGRGNHGGRHRRGMNDDDAHRGHRCGDGDHRARSSSTSSSSSDDHHGRRRRGKWRRGRSSSTSSSSSDDHHGRGKGRRHRSWSTSSSSSSSSSSSNDSARSISSDELRGVEVADIRQAIANFRLDPTRKQHVKQAVRQLRSELRSHRKSVSRDDVAQSKALRSETRTQKRLIKSEVKSLRKEAKQYKKGLKHQRRAEKRIIKAEKRARRRGQGLNVSGLESYPTPIPGVFPGQLSGSCDAEVTPSLNDLDHSTIKPQAEDLQRDLGMNPHFVNDLPRTTACPFRSISKYGSDSKKSNEKQDLATGGDPRGSNARQRPGVAHEPQMSTTSGLWGVGVDAEEMRRRAVENAIKNQMAGKRQEALDRKQEKEIGNHEREAENRTIHQTKDAEHRKTELERSNRERERATGRREKDAELRVREAHKAAALRRNEEERAAEGMRRGLERDAAQRKWDQERAAAERERAASRQQRHLDRARDIVGQRQRSQIARQEDLVDIGASADTSRGLVRGFNSTTPPVNPRAPGSGPFSGRLGVSIGEWGTRFGRDAGEWGERFGRDMGTKFSQV